MKLSKISLLKKIQFDIKRKQQVNHLKLFYDIKFISKIGKKFKLPLKKTQILLMKMYLKIKIYSMFLFISLNLILRWKIIIKMLQYFLMHANFVGSIADKYFQLTINYLYLRISRNWDSFRINYELKDCLRIYVNKYM